jgi:hypothetical protein
VQDAQKTNLSTQMLGVGRDLQHGGRAGLKQKVIEDVRIALTKWNQGMRQCEDYVEVRHAEQFFLSRGEPALARLRLTLGAVAVAAAVIRDGLVAAAWTIIDMSAQSRCSALSDGAQHLQLLIAEMLAVLVHEPSALCMNEISHLEGGTAHSALCSFRERLR